MYFIVTYIKTDVKLKLRKTDIFFMFYAILGVPVYWFVDVSGRGKGGRWEGWKMGRLEDGKVGRGEEWILDVLGGVLEFAFV